MLRITKDRYRPVFCSDLFYRENQKLFSKWNQLFKDLSSTQKAQAWIVGLCLLRRPSDWFGGIRKPSFITTDDHTYLHPIRLKELECSLSEIQLPFKLKDFDLFQCANQVQIKALPETALRALTCLTNQKYPIEIIQYVPTPEELLRFQLEEKRVLSFNEAYDTWPTTLYHGRDFLSFMIHDLIHADHFFANASNRAGQLGFYRCVQMILKQDALQTLLLSPSFKEAFEYIISDMNSHPVHLFKTLHARLQHATENELKAFSIWRDWTSVWSFGDLTVNSALQKINTQLFSDKDALKLTEWSIALGHNSRLA